MSPWLLLGLVWLSGLLIGWSATLLIQHYRTRPELGPPVRHRRS